MGKARTSTTAVLGTALSVTVALAACSGGKNAVDQNSGNQFRYVQGTSKGTVIHAAERKAAGTYSLAADRGKVVVLNFLASWCGPCQDETPQFDALYRQRKASGVQFVGLDVKDPSRSASQAWIKDKDITFPVVYDEAARSALQLGDVPLAALPSTVVIDKQGRVAAVYISVLLPKDLEPVLDTLTKEA